MSKVKETELNRNADAPETLDLGVVLDIAFSLKKLLVAILIAFLLLGGGAWYLLQSKHSASVVLNLQTKQGQSLLSIGEIMTEKSILQDSHIITSVIEILGGAEAYLVDYKGDFNQSLNEEDLLLYAIKYYSSRLTIYNYPSSSVLVVTILGSDAYKTASLVNLHVEQYLEKDLSFAQLEYQRLRSVLLASSEEKFNNFTLFRDELMSFATKNDIFNLQLNDRDLVELGGGEVAVDLNLSPADELKLDYLTREYKRSRDAYFEKKDVIANNEHYFSIRPLPALIIASATIGENISPSIAFALFVAALIGLLAWFIVVIFIGLLQSGGIKRGGG